MDHHAFNSTRLGPQDAQTEAKHKESGQTVPLELPQMCAAKVPPS